MIKMIRIPISRCASGIYLRWYFNGWHYFNFTNGYEVTMKTESMDTQVTNLFSRISKIERATKLKAEYSYQVTLEGILSENINGFTGLLLAEKVEQYEDLIWREVEITRGAHLIKDQNAPAYILNFEITRKELPNAPAVFQKSLYLYIGEILCDLDTDEVIPINKQVNDIAEMKDRQSDFTAQFNIRKTRAMIDLFEMSGEIGANTKFPYENQACKLIQDGIEMITNGQLVFNKSDSQYYNVSIISGNKKFFNDIEKKKLSDLTLDSTNHIWNNTNQRSSHNSDLDYVYPIMEPSDDAGIIPMGTDPGDVRAEVYGGWIWPFIKIKTIWDEIFTNAGYICEGEILTDPHFLKLFMPITSLVTTKKYTDKYLYSMGCRPGTYPLALNIITGVAYINGDDNWRNGHYITPFTATYSFRISIMGYGIVPLFVYSGLILAATFTFNTRLTVGAIGVWDAEYAALSSEDLTFQASVGFVEFMSLSVMSISNPLIGYSSIVTTRNHLPDITQTDFIKMICNMFGLIPDTIPRDKKIIFWNMSSLYDNIFIARDWSEYLSEFEDEVEFKFGDYAQNNYLNFKPSDDVKKDNGRGNMIIEDDTLTYEKDILELPFSTCDEVEVLVEPPAQVISRIAFNKRNLNDYDPEETIDPRIVLISRCPDTKTFGFRATVAPSAALDATSPKKASSLEVSFSYMVINYAGLSRMLTKINMRRAKFNLPVYEVAGLKHYIPIYLSQYKAYFYVNKINNYVPGKLCTVDLIKL